MTAAPAYGWYGDDLTGATDTLATIARRGRRAFLFLDVPTPAELAATGPLDAIGIAGAGRTMSPDAMRNALPSVAQAFADLGVRLVHYKCCSTFDSAPAIGNLATAIEIFGAAIGKPVIPILGGQPSLGRYCAFSNLFAVAGGAVHRIDRHPTMSRHPSTPMHEADLVRHFAALGLPGVAAIHWPRLAGGGLPAAWQDVVATSPPAILIDTLEQVHVEAIGPLLHGLADRRPTLAVGASSVAEAWFGPTVTEPDHPATGAGPTLALIGSLSPATRAQVKAASTYTVIEAQPGDLAAHHDDIVASAARVLRQGRNVMVSTAPRHGAAPDIALSGLANASATLLNAILAAAPVRRLAVAGGDTSTTAISALGFRGLSYHGLAAPGVTICRGAHPDPQRDGMLLLLKGGQMGHATLFDDFAAPGHAAEAATTDA